jgi:hypothetical protein
VFFASWCWHPQGKAIVEKPDHPFSLFEGIAGAVSLITDILTLPRKVQFPAYDFDF